MKGTESNHKISTQYTHTHTHKIGDICVTSPRPRSLSWDEAHAEKKQNNQERSHFRLQYHQRLTSRQQLIRLRKSFIFMWWWVSIESRWCPKAKSFLFLEVGYLVHNLAFNLTRKTRHVTCDIKYYRHLIKFTVDLKIESLTTCQIKYCTPHNEPDNEQGWIAWEKLLTRKEAGNRPDGLTEFYVLACHLRETFSELNWLFNIAFVVPVSTACACERSFSTMRVVKSYLRNRMTDPRDHWDTSERAMMLDL